MRSPTALAVLLMPLVSCGDDTSPTSPTPIDAPPPAPVLTGDADPVTGPDRPMADHRSSSTASTVLRPTVRKLIELPAVEVGGTIQLRSTCDIPATWQTSDAAVATVDDGLVTGVAPGRARISETCGGDTSSVSIEVVAAPAVSYAFDPTPPARIDEGDTGHFRVNVVRDGRRARVTEGVTSSAPAVLRLDLEGDRWRYTGTGPGSAEIRVTQGDTRRLTHSVTVTAPTVSYAFDPTPPARIDEGATGHFRVNVTRDGRRSRVTEGVTSSAPDVLRLDLEGDRWRYTGTGPGSAEIRVTQGDTRRLTHAVDVRAAPAASYDYEITNVVRYQSVIDTADWLEFRWIAHVTASRFRVRVTFPQGAFRTTCTETWFSPEAGEQNDEISIPSVCGADEQWSSVTIEPDDGRTCRGCGTFRRSALPRSRNLGPASERNALREEMDAHR